MSLVQRLGEWKGELCVYDEDTHYGEPTKFLRWWPTGIRAFDFYRNYGEDLRNAPVRHSGAHGVYEVMTKQGSQPLRIQLARGGATVPIHFEKVPYPCPRVKIGTKTRYYDGKWWKLLKTRGWVQI